MKILIIGRTGQLGGDLLRNNQLHEIYAPGRDEVDISSPQTVEAAIHSFRPDVLINTAAFHNVPLCEKNPEKAFRINCIAVRDLTLLCKKSGVFFITFSTDYVFGGSKRVPYTEEDKPGPVQFYGISRVAGEYAALSVDPGNCIVIRTCGLYGISGAVSKGGNFVDNRIKDAATTSHLEIGCDQIVCPTYTGDLSRAIFQLLEHPDRQSGIYHLVNDGECSWYEFTQAIYEIMGLDVELRPVDRGGMSGEMKRPLYSVLSTMKAKALGIALPHWRDGLVKYLQEKYSVQG